MEAHISENNVLSYRPRTWNFTAKHRDVMETHFKCPSTTMLGQNTTSRLLSLPLEIRMEIYKWLHLMSPVRHAQLAPWYPTPPACEYVAKPVCDPTDDASDTVADASSSWKRSTKASPSLLSPHRPLSALPSALLRTNSQIYYEARGIPFERNEFIFVNWFASGLWAARAFTRALKPWQREHLSQVRLEVVNLDFGGSGFGEWQALCSDWFAVTGLRLKMVIGHGYQERKEPEPEQPKKDLSKLMQQSRERVADGLLRMRSLQRLEMELATDDLDEGGKLAWCRELEEVLRESGMETTVLCTEKASKKGMPKLDWLQKAELSSIVL